MPSNRLINFGDAATEDRQVRTQRRGNNAMSKYQRPAWANKFYGSNAWRECRVSYAASVGGLCERCLANGHIVPGDIVHHKTPLNATNINDPTITLNWSNLEMLCARCHADVHGHRRWKVDEYGRIT